MSTAPHRGKAHMLTVSVATDARLPAMGALVPDKTIAIAQVGPSVRVPHPGGALRAPARIRRSRMPPSGPASSVNTASSRTRSGSPCAPTGTPSSPKDIDGGRPGGTGGCIIKPGVDDERRMPPRFGDQRLKTGDVLRRRGRKAGMWERRSSEVWTHAGRRAAAVRVCGESEERLRSCRPSRSHRDYSRTRRDPRIAS